MSASAFSQHDQDERLVTTMQGPGRELIAYVYRALRDLAAAKLRRMPAGDTLQATDLVHETYMRLSKHPNKIWKGRRHFYRAAALAMRHILIERARGKKAIKNGGELHRTELTITMPDRKEALLLAPEVLLTLDQALRKLQTEHPDLIEIVLMRYFCGLTVAEIADVLRVGKRTVERNWTFARAWLFNQLQDLSRSSP